MRYVTVGSAPTLSVHITIKQRGQLFGDENCKQVKIGKSAYFAQKKYPKKQIGASFLLMKKNETVLYLIIRIINTNNICHNQCVVTILLVQNTQEIKRTLFYQTKQDKTCKFSRKSSFSSYVQQYNRKRLNQLILCQFDVRRLAGGNGYETA